MTDREKILKIMELPKDIRKKSESEINNILFNHIMDIIKALDEIECPDIDYELSGRQMATRANAIRDIDNKYYIDGYYEIMDFIDDYGDHHDGIIYLTEQKEMYVLLAGLLYGLIQEDEF